MATHAYAIADLHLGHGTGVLRFRTQFETVEEHDRFVIDSINEVVNPNDTLYLLGDTVIREAGWFWINKINCRNMVEIPGNHCGERTPIREVFFKSIMGAYARRLPSSDIGAVFTHIPVHPSCLDRWQVNVHGHLHDQVIDDPRYLCVSCEAVDYRPVNMEQIRDIFKSRGFK